MGRTETRSRMVDTLDNIAGSDILAGYRVYKRDENVSPDVSYYGFVDSDGNWFIQRETPFGAITITEYARGTSNFETNWTGRGALTYLSFDQVF